MSGATCVIPGQYKRPMSLFDFCPLDTDAQTIFGESHICVVVLPVIASPVYDVSYPIPHHEYS